MPLVVDLVAYRKINLTLPRHTLPFIAVVGTLAVLHILGIALNSTAYSYLIGRDLIWALAIVVISLFGPAESQAADTVRGFTAAVAVFVSILASIGVIKFALQREGVVFQALIDSCGVPYPQGTVVCGDYNLLALSMLFGAIGLSSIVLNRQKPFDLPAFFLLVALSLTLTAGFFSGSRRFAFAATLVLVMWSLHALWTGRFLHVLKLALLPTLLTVAFYAGLNAPKNATKDTDIVIVASPSWMDSTPKPSLQGNDHSNPYLLAPRTVSTTALATTIELGSRWDRWRYAVSLLAEDGFLIGGLFSYHEKFSCRFVGCKTVDYPHSTLLSATLAFGVVGALLAILFYALAVFNIWAAGKAGWLVGVSPIVVAAMPYSLLSGDTVFSIWHVVVAVALLNIIPKPLLAPAAKWLRKQTTPQSVTQLPRP